MTRFLPAPHAVCRRAALEYLSVSMQQPHIIQVHDWHTAAVPMLFWEVRSCAWGRLGVGQSTGTQHQRCAAGTGRDCSAAPFARRHTASCPHP